MIIIQFIEFLQKWLKVVVWISYAVLLSILIMDNIPSIMHKEHAHTGIEHLPGFWAIFGFVICTLIIFLSKWYGQMGIRQQQDYYEKFDVKANEPTVGGT